MTAVRPIRLIAGFFTVGLWTMASRVLGFIRDIMIAAFMGAGPAAEAFLVAFALPNMFRRFFAEGAFNTAFVPLFSKKLEGKEDAEGFAREAFTGLASVLILITLLAQLVMPWLVLAMAGGFSADERLPLATFMGRFAFPYILFISLAALASGVLNAAGRFAAAAAAPVLLNVILIAAMLLAEMTQSLEPDVPGLWHGLFLAVAVPLAGIAQLILVWIAAARAGFRLIPVRPRFSPDMKRLVLIMGPAMLAGGVVQINLLVGRQVASFFDGAIVWLSLADRVYQLPLGVVGIAIGVVLLPELSRRLRAGDAAGGQAALSRAGELALALTIPAAAALIVIPLPIVSVMFERGAFTQADAQATALALGIYGAGLPAFVLQKVLQPIYFAREDTRTPFRYALVAMAVNAAAAIGFALVLGFVGAAIGTTLAGWVMAWLLWRGARGLGPEAQFDDRFRRKLPRIVAASLVMAVVLFVLSLGLGVALETEGLRYLALAGLIIAGGASYFGAAHVLDAVRVSELRSALRR